MVHQVAVIQAVAAEASDFSNKVTGCPIVNMLYKLIIKTVLIYIIMGQPV